MKKIAPVVMMIVFEYHLSYTVFGSCDFSFNIFVCFKVKPSRINNVVVLLLSIDLLQIDYKLHIVSIYYM